MGLIEFSSNREPKSSLTLTASLDLNLRKQIGGDEFNKEREREGEREASPGGAGRASASRAGRAGASTFCCWSAAASAGRRWPSAFRRPPTPAGRSRRGPVPGPEQHDIEEKRR